MESKFDDPLPVYTRFPNQTKGLADLTLEDDRHIDVDLTDERLDIWADGPTGPLSIHQKRIAILYRIAKLNNNAIISHQDVKGTEVFYQTTWDGYLRELEKLSAEEAEIVQSASQELSSFNFTFSRHLSNWEDVKQHDGILLRDMKMYSNILCRLVELRKEESDIMAAQDKVSKLLDEAVEPRKILEKAEKPEKVGLAKRFLQLSRPKSPAPSLSPEPSKVVLAEEAVRIEGYRKEIQALEARSLQNRANLEKASASKITKQRMFFEFSFKLETQEQCMRENLTALEQALNDGTCTQGDIQSVKDKFQQFQKKNEDICSLFHHIRTLWIFWGIAKIYLEQALLDSETTGRTYPFDDTPPKGEEPKNVHNIRIQWWNGMLHYSPVEQIVPILCDRVNGKFPELKFRIARPVPQFNIWGVWPYPNPSPTYAYLDIQTAPSDAESSSAVGRGGNTYNVPRGSKILIIAGNEYVLLHMSEQPPELWLQLGESKVELRQGNSYEDIITKSMSLANSSHSSHSAAALDRATFHFQ